jgi:murein DD-endopeptidase MepM/ murein hydrolase activator NlpD
MKTVGETIGQFIGEALGVMANLLTGAKDFVTGGKFAEGLSKGLQDSNAFGAIREIFKGVFETMGKAIFTIATELPVETLLYAGITTVLPAAIAALGTKIGMTLGTVLSNAGAMIQASLLGTKAATGAGAATTAAISGGTAHAALTGKAAPVAGAAVAKTGTFAALIPLLGKFALVLAAIVGVVGLFVGFDNAIKGAMTALSDMGSAISGTLGPIFQGLGDILGSIFNSLYQAFLLLFPGIGRVTSGMDGLHAATIAFKIVLTPIVAAFQLFEQIINTLVLAFRGLELAVLVARLGLSKLNPFADKAAQTRLEQEVTAAAGRAVEAQGRVGESFKRHQEYYQTPKPSTASGLTPALTPATTVPTFQAPPTMQAPVVMQAPPPPNPIPAIEALSTKQSATNAHLAQIDAKTLPQQQINPVPQLQVANTNLTAVQEYVKGVTASVEASKNELKQQIAASSNNIQARIQEGTAATRAITNAFSAGINVRVTNSPTVKFDMGAVGPVGGGIGGFPKTSGYGMRWGKMHTGNDYGMPVGTKLGIGGPGKVLGAGYWGGYGNTMDIGGPGGMVYRFAHLSKFNAPVGANLPPGYPFALSGNTGNSTGPHLHFEARPGGLGPVNPDAFAGIIRANYGGTPLGPLMGAMGTEMQNMPYGSQLAVSNSDEIFMKPKQMAHVIESSARAGAEGVGNVSMSGVTININGYDKDPKELTDNIASELLTAIYRKSRSEVLTS